MTTTRPSEPATRPATAGRRLNSKWEGRPDEYDRLRQCWLNERRLRFLAERIGSGRLPDGARVLEIGSGTGWLLRRLAETFLSLDFTGVEPDASYVEFANLRASENEQHAAAVAETLAVRFPAASFHLVLSNDVLHHVGSIPQVFSATAAVSAPGAQWWLIEPNFLNPYTFVKQRFTHGERNFYPRGALHDAAISGWRLVSRRNLFLIPPFIRSAPAWMRAVERRWETNPILAGGICLHLIHR